MKTGKDEIIALFKKRVTPLSFREILALSRLTKADSRPLKRLLRQMVKEGLITKTKRHLYAPVSATALASGYFEAHRDGYGFVILNKPNQKDIFIPGRRTGGAMDNDRVIVRIDNPVNREGTIVRISERANTEITGRIEDLGGHFALRPSNRLVSINIHIHKKEARGAKVDDYVTVRIIEYPFEHRPAYGKVVKIHKRPQNPSEDMDFILEEFNLPKRFPKSVLSEVKAIDDEIDYRNRKDYRTLPTVTIDGENAKDFDDAVSIERHDSGYRLYVHIADVGHYVRLDSPLDIEARERATSVYLPDRVIPMLPKTLSEDLCSLKPNKERPVFTVEIDYEHNGDVAKTSFHRGVIVSDKRMTYTELAAMLVDKDEKVIKRYRGLFPMFEDMARLCNQLREKRLQRGSLDFDLPEPQVLLDIRGNPEDIIREERNFAHMIIEEFMIAANVAVAEFLTGAGVQMLYRVHEPPDEEKMGVIARLLRSITGVARRNFTSSDLHKALRETEDTPYKETVNYIVLRSLKQASYSPENVGHFGLALNCYTHFTSPIRRYPDLVVHRILAHYLTNGTVAPDIMELPTMALRSSRMERNADAAERQAVEALKAWFLKDRIGEIFNAIIYGTVSKGLKVRLNEYYIEGFVHLSDITDDYYVFDEEHLSFKGRNRGKILRIGDDISVRIERVEPNDREIVMSLHTSSI